jgi:DNA (cytosine-5)-methyltransferase 1
MQEGKMGGGKVSLVQAVDVYNQTIDGDVAATLTKAVGGTNTSGAKVMAFKPGQSAKARSLGAQVEIACTLEGGGGGNNKVAVAFEPGIAKREGNASRFVEEMSPTLRKDMGDNQVAVAVDTYNQALQDKAIPIRSWTADICHTGGVINPKDRMAVRRLTPRECERLQGFPDDWTLIPWRGKPADQCPDGPRYKALGNSMAVPCMAWIGKRIADAEASK